MEIEDCSDGSKPKNCAKGESKMKAAEAWRARRRAEGEFFRQVPWDENEEEKWEAKPASRSEPGFVEGEFEPCSEEEKQN